MPSARYNTDQTDWTAMSDQQQLIVAREAMRQASQTIAGQAEILAAEMEDGSLIDRGGPDALRLLAAVLRVTGNDTIGWEHGMALHGAPAMGHA